jgi:hypothetical protein
VPSGTDLDERQTRVVEALEGRSPKLAGVYRAALLALATPAAAGGEAARISVVCHCMRELMNGLPSVMTDSSIPRPSPSSGALVDKLPGLLAKHTDFDLGANQDLVPVPKQVASAFAELIGTVTREQGRNRRNAAELVTGGADTKHPAIKQWVACQQFFVGWTHLDRNHAQDRELPTDDELLANIRVLEDVVEVRTALFFDNVHSLEDLLADANAVGGEVAS